jgi:serine/threonine protein kinase
MEENKYGYPIDYVKQFTLQLFEAMSFIHSMRLTHTDIKPENILFVDETLVESEDGLMLP